MSLAGGQGVNAGAAEVADAKRARQGAGGHRRSGQEGPHTHRRAARKGHTLERTFGNRYQEVRPDTWVTKDMDLLDL